MDYSQPHWHRLQDGTWSVKGSTDIVIQGAKLNVPDRFGPRVVTITRTARPFSVKGKQVCFGYTKSIPGLPDPNPLGINPKGVNVHLFYVLIDPRGDQVRYVGQTRYRLESRLHEHLLPRTDSRRAFWVLELKDLGLIPLIQQIDKQKVAKRDALRIERSWIDKYCSEGYDLVNDMGWPKK